MDQLTPLIMKVHPEGGYVEGLVKKVLAFGWKHFPSINFVSLHSLSSNLQTVKWGLREGYGGPNIGEKRFQLFQLL